MSAKFVSFLFVLCLIILSVDCRDNRSYFGSVIDVTGNVSHYSQKKGKWRPLKKEVRIFFRDSIRTEKNSWAEVKFDKSTVKLEDSTLVCIEDSSGPKKRTITVRTIHGGVLSSIHDLDTLNTVYRVQTATTVAEAKGTHYLVFFDPIPRISHVNVFSGRVSVFNPLLPVPPVLVLPGFFTTVHHHHPPLFPAKLNYGHFKKMEKALGHKHFKHYSGIFKLHPSAVPVPFPDKHLARDLQKAHRKAGKGGAILIPAPVIPVPVPVPVPVSGNTKNSKGKSKGRGRH